MVTKNAIFFVGNQVGIRSIPVVSVRTSITVHSKRVETWRGEEGVGDRGRGVISGVAKSRSN